jgi:hypothetical protein
MQRAVNDHEDKKQRRSNQSHNQPQQGYSGHESQMGNNAHNIRDNTRDFENPINQSPPPYHQAGGQAGSAQEYYSGKKL